MMKIMKMKYNSKMFKLSLYIKRKIYLDHFFKMTMLFKIKKALNIFIKKKFLK